MIVNSTVVTHDIYFKYCCCVHAGVEGISIHTREIDSAAVVPTPPSDASAHHQQPPQRRQNAANGVSERAVRGTMYKPRTQLEDDVFTSNNEDASATMVRVRRVRRRVYERAV